MIINQVGCVVDAGTPGISLAPLWGDHYDLSLEHLAYTAEPGFLTLTQALAPRSWRCSVGRWEIGTPPPLGADSTDPAVLKLVDREYYRGPNTLIGADDPANYDFTYLDAQLATISSTGAEPFLCFDMMPFTLSSEQDPFNASNFGLTDPAFSYSNGIRTAPPADPAVYARVVRNAVRHVRGLFAGTTDFGVGWIEIGNEPDLVDPTGAPLPYFWTGTLFQWAAMYSAIAAEIDADASIGSLVQLGGGSFAFPPSGIGPPFLSDFIAGVALSGDRLDFVSYHSYDDTFEAHFIALVRLDAILSTLGVDTKIVNGEWGRRLDGVDPVYDEIEHGLLRTKVMIAMQLFGVQLAHEAVFRNPIPADDILGLIHTGPIAPKPVSDVYLGLAKLNDALLALPLVVTADTFFMAGTDAAGTKVVIVHVGEDPPAGTQTRVKLDVGSLPWGPANFDATRYVVSEATFAAGLGLAVDQTWVGLDTGEFTDVVSFGPGPGQGRLYVWELIRQ